MNRRRFRDIVIALLPVMLGIQFLLFLGQGPEVVFRTFDRWGVAGSFHSLGYWGPILLLAIVMSLTAVYSYAFGKSPTFSRGFIAVAWAVMHYLVLVICFKIAINQGFPDEPLSWVVSFLFVAVPFVSFCTAYARREGSITRGEQGRQVVEP